MNITFVASGDLPVPPLAYGGVELGIWNRGEVLRGEGHRVAVVNIPKEVVSIVRRWRVIRAINQSKPDVVHIHVSKYFRLARWLRCRAVLFSDHNPGVSFANYKYHRRANVAGAHVMCLSEKIKNLYAGVGIDEKYLHVVPNEVAISNFKFTPQPKHPDKSICLGVIENRKRQYAIKDIPNIDFAGPVFEPVEFHSGSYLGEWTREQVSSNLTDYANMVLLSAAEAHNRVCMEALAAGLGLVVSNAAADNLDLDLPFIDVIPDDKIHDAEFVAKVIAENRSRALPRRAKIRAYAEANFDTAQIVKAKYLPLLKSIVNAK